MAPEHVRKNVVSDPLYVGIQRVKEQCPSVGTMLENMYSAGRIAYGPMQNPTHSAETTWTFDRRTLQIQPGSHRITLDPSLNNGSIDEAADRAHYWLAHEAGHVLGEVHPEVAGANTQTGEACY